MLFAEEMRLFRGQHTRMEWDQTDEQDEEQELQPTLQPSFYALLNVDQNASSEEITKVYKAASLSFHPDKQHPDDRDAAQKTFLRIQRAYEVLSDPAQRAIYDVLGEEGLSQKWAVGQKFKSPSELRAEFTQHVQRRKLEELENLVDTTISVDGTSIFAPSELFRSDQSVLQQRFHHIQARNLTIRNSFDLPLSEQTKLSLAGNASVNRFRSFTSNSGLTASLKHSHSSSLNFQATTALLQPYSSSLKANYTPDRDSFHTVSAACKTLADPPNLTFVTGRSMGKGLTSFMTFKTGSYQVGLWGSNAATQRLPSLGLGLTSYSGWTINTSSTAQGSSLSLDWNWKPTKDIRAKLSASVFTTGEFSLSATGEHRIPYDAWLALILSCGSNGLILRVRWTRLGQRLVIPIVLAREPEFLLAAQLAVVPAVTTTLLHHLYLIPRKKRKIASRLKELQAEHAEQLQESYQEALNVQRMQAEQVERRLAAEKQKDGLVILTARYGVPGSDQQLDVRIPLQALVTNSQLLVPPGRSKSGLLGFCDLQPGEAKRLLIEYEFKGRRHQVEYADKAAVTLPLQLHLVE